MVWYINPHSLHLRARVTKKSALSVITTPVRAPHSGHNIGHLIAFMAMITRRASFAVIASGLAYSLPVIRWAKESMDLSPGILALSFHVFRIIHICWEDARATGAERPRR